MPPTNLLLLTLLAEPTPHHTATGTAGTLLIYLVILGLVLALSYTLATKYSITSPSLLRHALDLRRPGTYQYEHGYGYYEHDSDHSSVTTAHSTSAPPSKNSAARQTESESRRTIESRAKNWAAVRTVATERLMAQGAPALTRAQTVIQAMPSAEAQLPTWDLTTPLLPARTVRGKGSPLQEVTCVSVGSDMRGYGGCEVGDGKATDIKRAADTIDAGGRGEGRADGPQTEPESLSRSDTLVNEPMTELMAAKPSSPAQGGDKKAQRRFKLGRENTGRQELAAYHFREQLENEIRAKILKEQKAARQKLAAHRARKEEWRLTGWRMWFMGKGRLEGDTGEAVEGGRRDDIRANAKAMRARRRRKHMTTRS